MYVYNNAKKRCASEASDDTTDVQYPGGHWVNVKVKRWANANVI